MVQQMVHLIPQGLALLAMFPDPFSQCLKMRECVLPLLVLHGEDDNIVPIEQGEALFDASAASTERGLKHFKRYGLDWDG